MNQKKSNKLPVIGKLGGGNNQPKKVWTIILNGYDNGLIESNYTQGIPKTVFISALSQQAMLVAGKLGQELKQADDKKIKVVTGVNAEKFRNKDQKN